MSSGKQFFDEHMQYVFKGDLEGLVRDTYAKDAVLYHNFPFFPGEPPYVAKGWDEIIHHETVIFAPENQGKITSSEPFNFIATDDFIGFQIWVSSPNTGKWLITDAWQLENGKIKIYYAMGYNVEPA